MRSCDSATNRRDAADFEVPSPSTRRRWPSGNLTARPILRVATPINMRFMAVLPSQSSLVAAAQLGSISSSPARADPRSNNINFAAAVADLASCPSPAVAPALRVSGMPTSTQAFHIGSHHALQSLDPGRQAKPTKAGINSLPSLFHSWRDWARAGQCRFRHGIAFLDGLDARNLMAQGKQSRLPYFNIDRDIPGSNRISWRRFTLAA
jgi:hypothetical protein